MNMKVKQFPARGMSARGKWKEEEKASPGLYSGEFNSRITHASQFMSKPRFHSTERWYSLHYIVTL